MLILRDVYDFSKFVIYYDLGFIKIIWKKIIMSTLVKCMLKRQIVSDV